MPKATKVRPEKAKEVELLKEKFSTAKSLFLTDFTGLNMGDMFQLRRELRKSKAEFRVSKNTLIRRALEGTNYATVSEQLSGQTGLGFGYDDSTLPAKILHDFFKRIEKPKVKLFFLEGRQYAGKELSQIATLPSREVLLAQLIGAIQAPIANLVGTLEGMLSNLVRTIEAIKDKKENQTDQPKVSN